MYAFARDYFNAIYHYWWLMVFVVIGAPNSVWKWLHPNRKDIPIPHWLRLAIAIGAVVIAQGLAYRDSLNNLSRVIDEKKALASENWHLNNPTTVSQQTANQQVGVRHGDKNNPPHPLQRTIQDRLVDFISQGTSVRKEWLKRLGTSVEVQREWANEAGTWHRNVEDYLRTIPRGNLYLAKFRNPTASTGAYPIGISFDLGGSWDTLTNDLKRLNEFLDDPNLGKP